MQFNINGCKWEVLECSGSEIPLNDGFFFGRTFFLEKRIYINNALPHELKIKTLRHELTHAFLAETQINQEKEQQYSEEMLCDFVGHYGGQIEAIVDSWRDEKIIAEYEDEQSA